MIAARTDAAALAGIRVLDLTTNYAAYAGRLLADLGAHVVRVQDPQGSPLRQVAPSRGAPSGEVVSFAHAFLDAGKRSVTLDLADAEGAELFAQLAAGSDVVFETPSPSVLARPPLDFADLRRHHPGLVVVSISPFGPAGPSAGHA